MSGAEGYDPAQTMRQAEAARWRAVLAETEAGSTPEFEAWLAEPENRTAWIQISVPWNFLGEHADAPELAAIRQEALRDMRQVPPPLRPRWRRMVGSIAAVVVLGVAVAGGILWMQRPAEYATAQGERRVITLADGSRVSLDSNSKVTVRYTETARRLQLLQGQARFDVAHDLERPFSVLAGGEKVLATGTAFNVDLSGAEVRVTLIEGHVVVVDEKSGARLTPSGAHQQVELMAGEELIAPPQKPVHVEPANIKRVVAWMNGQLIFDNEPLAQVAATVSRYTTAPIEIHDPKVGALRISGVFNTGDVGEVVDVVTQYLPVRAVRESNGTIVLESDLKD